MYYNKYDSVHHQYLTIFQYIFLKLIGLSPWSIRHSVVCRKSRKINNVQNNVCNFSFVGSFYNFMLSIFVLSLTLYSFYNVKIIQVQHDSLITESTMTNLEYLAALITSIVYLIYLFRQKIIIDALNKLENVDYKLQRCVMFTSENHYMIHLLFMGNLLSCCIGSVAGFYVFNRSLVMTLLRFSPSFNFSWIIIEYTIMLNLINRKFKSINLMMKKFLTVKTSEDQLQPCFGKIIVLRASVIHDINNIKSAYIKLGEICQEISDFYGILFLIALLYNGSSSLFLSYFMILSFYKTIKLSLAVTTISGGLIIWMLLQIMLLTTYVNRTINEVYYDISNKLLLMIY